MAKKSYTPLLILGGLAAAGFWYSQKPKYPQPSMEAMGIGGWVFYWQGSTPITSLPAGMQLAGRDGSRLPIGALRPGGLYAYSPSLENPLLILVKPGVPHARVAAEAAAFNEANPQ